MSHVTVRMRNCLEIKMFVLGSDIFLHPAAIWVRTSLKQFSNWLHSTVDTVSMLYAGMPTKVVRLPSEARDFPFLWKAHTGSGCNQAPYTMLCKVTPKNRPRKPRGGAEVMLYYFFHLGARWWWVITPRPGRFTPGKTRYPLYRRLGGPQGRSGRGRKISPPPGFDPRSES